MSGLSSPGWTLFPDSRVHWSGGIVPRGILEALNAALRVAMPAREVLREETAPERGGPRR